MNNAPLFESWRELEALLLPFFVRCGTAAICGALIGLERELKQKPAGLRTNILICVGSALYMCVGLLLANAAGQSTDASRIAAQVVTGIGFLGAGSIIQSGGKVMGLTTAATIWVVAGIGLVAGAGFPLLALVAAGMTLLTLAVLGAVEQRFFDQ